MSEFKHIQQYCRLFYEFRVTVILLTIGVICFFGYLFLRTAFQKRSVSLQAKLVNTKEVTYDTKIFTFSLPDGMNKVDLNIGEHL